MDTWKACFEKTLVALLPALILCVVILSCVPPTAKDELVHHLAVPKLYLKHGGMYEIPFMPFSYYPMNLQLLYLIPLYFGNDIIPKFIHFAFALLTAWLLFRYLRKRINRVYALFGALLFLSIPLIIKLSITAYIDLGIIFFSTASLLFLLEWAEKDFKLKYLLVAGVFCGLALGTKYNGLITLFLLTLFVPFIYARASADGKPGLLKPAWQGMVFFFVSLVVFSPWMIRNYHWTANPIYPLYNSWFNPSKSPIEKEAPAGSEGEERRGGHSLFAYRKVIYGEKGWQMALLPLRIFFQGKDGDPQYFDGKLNPILLLLSLFAFYRSRQDPPVVRQEKKILLAFSVLFFAFALFSFSLRMRYIAPIIPPLVILSVFGLRNLMDLRAHYSIGAARKMMVVLVLALAFFMSFNGRYVVNQFREIEPVGYLSGAVSREEYLERHRPDYAAMRFINNHLPQDAKVMLVFLGGRGYYCDRSYIYADQALNPLFISAQNSQEIHSRLKGMGVTHLLIYDPLFGRWLRENMEERGINILKVFFSNYIKLIYTKKGFTVFGLENSSS